MEQLAAAISVSEKSGVGRLNSRTGIGERLCEATVWVQERGEGSRISFNTFFLSLAQVFAVDFSMMATISLSRRESGLLLFEETAILVEDEDEVLNRPHKRVLLDPVPFEFVRDPAILKEQAVRTHGTLNGGDQIFNLIQRLDNVVLRGEPDRLDGGIQGIVTGNQDDGKERVLVADVP